MLRQQVLIKTNTMFSSIAWTHTRLHSCNFFSFLQKLTHVCLKYGRKKIIVGSMELLTLLKFGLSATGHATTVGDVPTQHLCKPLLADAKLFLLSLLRPNGEKVGS